MKGLRTHPLSWGGQANLHQVPRATRVLPDRAEFQQQRIARDIHPLQLVQARPQFLELPPPHRRLLVAPAAATGQHVEVFPFPGQFDLDPCLHLRPGLSDELALELGEATPGRPTG